MLTEKKPPVNELMKGPDANEARKLRCEKEKAAFVALKLDAKGAVELYFLCPGNGQFNTEMLSKMNGLDSIVVKFDEKTDSRLKGTLAGGQGSCPDAEDNNKYCRQTSNNIFDAPVLKK